MTQVNLQMNPSTATSLMTTYGIRSPLSRILQNDLQFATGKMIGVQSRQQKRERKNQHHGEQTRTQADLAKSEHDKIDKLQRDVASLLGQKRDVARLLEMMQRLHPDLSVSQQEARPAHQATADPVRAAPRVSKPLLPVREPATSTAPKLKSIPSLDALLNADDGEHETVAAAHGSFSSLHASSPTEGPSGSSRTFERFASKGRTKSPRS